MIVDGPGLLLGLAVGAGVSSLYFAGLAVSVRLALSSSRPPVVLLSSALLRIGLLLTAGWLVTDGATRLWSLAGYVAGYVLVRTLATLAAQRPRPEDG